MRSITPFKLVIIALFAALICVATLMIQIPIPATGGYVNPGDGLILLCACLLSPLHAALAAGIGSLLADVLTGYIAFAPGTLVIKAGMALIAALMYTHFIKDRPARIALPALAVSGITTELFMVLGYFFYEAVILGIGAGAVSGIPGNLGQGAAAVMVVCVLAPVLTRSSAVSRFADKLR